MCPGFARRRSACTRARVRERRMASRYSRRRPSPAPNPVSFVNPRCEHDHRQLLGLHALGSGGRARCPIVRQHPVEEHKVRHLFPQADLRLVSPEGYFDFKPLRFEIVAQENW